LVRVKIFVTLGETVEDKRKENHLVHLKLARVFDFNKDSYITVLVRNIKIKQSLRNT
jgi:hypothetical protein